MRILTLNVLMGGAERFGALCAVVANAKPDVVVLQECFGWDEAKLDAFAKIAGTPTTFLGEANARPSGNRYHVALASKTAHESARVHVEGFTHCVVDVTLPGGLRILGAHFASADEDTRLAEARRVLNLVKPDERAVLAGDLNAIARHDPYPRSDELDAKLKRAEITKYGSPPRFDVMDALLEDTPSTPGFVDALHAKPKDKGRWVTAKRDKNGELVDTRTDYVLLSRAAAAELVEADVVDVGNASDHHAVLAVLR